MVVVLKSCCIQMEPSRNTSDRMLCPCTQCKYQIIRKRKICEDHVRRSCPFERERLQDLRFDSFSVPTCDEPTIDIRPQVRRRSSEPLRESIQTTVPNSVVEEHAMDDMLESFYENNVLNVANADVGDVHERAANVSNNDERIGRDLEEERM